MIPWYEQVTGQISNDELETLLKVSSSLASTLELGEVLQIAIESACGLVKVDTGAIYTLEKDILFLGAATPPLPPDLPQELLLARLVDHPHIEQALTEKAPVYLHDTSTGSLSPAERIVVESRKLRSILYFPLLLKDSAIGVFTIGTIDRLREFSRHEIDLCYTLSYQAAISIANAQLFQKAQRAVDELSEAYDATLSAWSKVLDMRDHATDEHTQRVAELAVSLAACMGVPPAQFEHIRKGALLHDIGKMGIPDSILRKQEPLTRAERAIMRTHPQKAFDLLSRINYLKPDMDIPYCHHEKWDGSGYPRKLKGEEIPLAARIFAVVDVFDALTSDRPYRKAWTRKKALAYIQRQSGRYFDPRAVEAFLKFIEEDKAA